MRKLPLFLLLLLTIQTGFAAMPSLRVAVTNNADSKPPRRYWADKERKGTMGFVASILLGPVGYFGVRLCTHSEPFRYQAARGLKDWCLIVAVSVVALGIAWYASATKTNDNDTLGNLFSLLFSGLAS